MATMYAKEGDFGGARGVFVQIPGHPGKLFSFKKCGGKAAARAEAARHIQELVDTSRANPKTGRFVRDPRKARGVFRHIRKVKAGGAEYRYPFWVAQAQIERGKTARREFSVKRYGEELAEALARIARQEMVKQILS